MSASKHMSVLECPHVQVKRGWGVGPQPTQVSGDLSVWGVGTVLQVLQEDPLWAPASQNARSFSRLEVPAQQHLNTHSAEKHKGLGGQRAISDKP